MSFFHPCYFNTGHTYTASPNMDESALIEDLRREKVISHLIDDEWK